MYRKEFFYDTEPQPLFISLVIKRNGKGGSLRSTPHISLFLFICIIAAASAAAYLLCIDKIRTGQLTVKYIIDITEHCLFAIIF